MKSGELDSVDAAPGLAMITSALNRPVAVADGADGRLDHGFGQASGVAAAHILRSPVGLVDKTAPPDWLPLVHRLLWGIEHEVGPGDQPPLDVPRQMSVQGKAAERLAEGGDVAAHAFL